MTNSKSRIRIAVSLVALCCASFGVGAPARAEPVGSPPAYIDMRAFGFGEANVFGETPSPLTDEEIDKKEQARFLENIRRDKWRIYNPDPDLSKKVMAYQKEYDEAEFEMHCRSMSASEGLYNSKFSKFYDRLSGIFPDETDRTVAMFHLSRVHDRTYGPIDDKNAYCERNKARHQEKKSTYKSKSEPDALYALEICLRKSASMVDSGYDYWETMKKNCYDEARDFLHHCTMNAIINQGINASIASDLCSHSMSARMNKAARYK